MNVKAYMLLETEVGMADEVVEEVRRVDGVKSADPVTGPYDVVANVEVATIDDIATVIKNIHSAAGITKTTTLIKLK